MMNVYVLVMSTQDDVYSDGSEGYYPEATLADFVHDFVSHLTSSPGSFESEIDYITDTLNGWVTTEDILQELVELIYVQVNYSWQIIDNFNHF